MSPLPGNSIVSPVGKRCLTRSVLLAACVDAAYRLRLGLAALLLGCVLTVAAEAQTIEQLSQLPPSPSEEVLRGYESVSVLDDEELLEDSWSGSSGNVFQILPQGLIYRAYLAGAKESRFQSFWSHDSHRGNMWDIVLGGHVGILRYGSTGNRRPTGIQLDIEGAGQPRLDRDHNIDLASADFRFGIPLTMGNERYQMKVAYYHLSSHLGDEFLLTHPGFPRINYSRDVLVWGHSFYATPDLRFYGEAGWAYYTDVCKPWEFQFGIDYSPGNATGVRGAPFAAVNGHLREEVDFGGNMVAQLGWAWRSSPASGLFRIGFEYFNGKSDQFSFYNFSENKVGAAIWYDY